MATSKHFLEQVKTGDVAAALQTALENAGSLKIVTYVAGAGSAGDLPDNQKIFTQIDAVEGTIETSVGEKFVQDENFKTLCDGHMQQVVAGCSSVRDNLDTIQALLDWVSEEPVAIDSNTSTASTVGDVPLDMDGNGESASAAGTFETGAIDDAGTVDAGTVGLAAAAGLGVAGVAIGNSPAEDSMLDVLDTPLDESLGDAGSLDGLESLEAPDAGDNALLENIDLSSDAGAELDLDLGEDSLSLDENVGLDSSLDLGDDIDLGQDANAEPSLDNDLGFDLGEAVSDGEDAGPATEFLVSDNSEDSTQLFGIDDGSNGEAAALETPDFGADLGDTSVSDDPLAGLELGGDLGDSSSPSDDPFNLGDSATTEAPINLEEDTLAGVSWAESGSGEGDLDIGALELGDNAAPDATPDPEVDDLALDAIGDFDSGMWDEASSETVDLKEGESPAGESPAKVSRSLESLFSADESAAPSAEGESSSGDPLSALFSDTSLDDIPGDAASSGEESQETLTANPFEIDDLENDPFADLMLDDPNS